MGPVRNSDGQLYRPPQIGHKKNVVLFQDWVLNIPECLDIRVSMSVNDRLGADIKLDEMLVDSDSEDDSSPTDPLADPTGYSVRFIMII